jgi:hypothetical protein
MIRNAFAFVSPGANDDAADGEVVGALQRLKKG